MQNLTEFEDKKFQNASKDDLKIGSKDEKAKFKEMKEEFKDLTKWWKNVLGTEKVETVKVSNRLADTPGVVVSSKFGWSANMERIMQAQTLTDVSKQAYMRGKRTLEINPRHPIIKDLKEKVAENPEVSKEEVHSSADSCCCHLYDTEVRFPRPLVEEKNGPILNNVHIDVQH